MFEQLTVKRILFEGFGHPCAVAADFVVIEAVKCEQALLHLPLKLADFRLHDFQSRGRVVVFGNFLGKCGGIQQKIGNFTARFRIQPLPLAMSRLGNMVARLSHNRISPSKSKATVSKPA